MKPPRTRTAEEIQQAHDRLHALVHGDQPPFVFLRDGLTPERQALLHGALNALCWALHHETGAMLDEVIDTAVAFAALMGYVEPEIPPDAHAPPTIPFDIGLN
jgi:hypothetical protein